MILLSIALFRTASVRSKQANLSRSETRILSGPGKHVLEPLYGYLLLGASLSIKGNVFSGPWNFGSLSAQSRTVEELVNELVAAWGKGTVKYLDPEKPRPKEAEYLHLNSSKATRTLGWKRIFTFREAVKNTVDEYRTMGHADRDGLFRDRIGRIKSFENRINTKK